MNDLKPCPLCGGSNLEVVNTPQGYFIGCSCGCFTGEFETREDAITAWNTRAQTVFGMTLDEVRQMMKRDAERERTCALPETRIDHGSIEYNGVTSWRKCSSCGDEVLAYPPRYCPHCGAKVVK